jgi:ribosomal-protein-alanine N-acetyltransferase
MKTRILIRPLVAADQKAFVTASRASVTLHGDWVSAPADARAFKGYLGRFDGKTNHGFVVCLAESGALVGFINLTNVVLGHFRSGYLGYFAFAGHEGRGLMKQGLKAVVRHAFADLGLHRMEANIQPGNTASIALVRSCGFRKEGYSPAYLKIAGRWRDHERWAIIK